MKFIFANGDSAFTKFNFVGRLDFSICAWGNTFDKREKLKHLLYLRLVVPMQGEF